MKTQEQVNGNEQDGSWGRGQENSAPKFTANHDATLSCSFSRGFSFEVTSL